MPGMMLTKSRVRFGNLTGSELYAYRRENNRDAITAHQSLEYLARYLFGDVQ